MNQDAAFRAVLVAGFLTIFAITLYHRLRSWKSKEPLDRQQEGFFILATLRPIALLMWVGLFAYMINPAWMAWSSIPRDRHRHFSPARDTFPDRRSFFGVALW